MERLGMLYCYVISFLLTWGALSTYWNFRWFWHGFGIGMGMIPFAFVGIHWWAILLRAVVLGILIKWWSDREDNAVKEEFGRGALMVLTLPIVFL